MADMYSSAQGVSGGSSNQLDQLVYSYMQSRQPELDVLTKKKTELETKRVYISNLRSKFNALTSQVDGFLRYKSNSEFDTSYQNDIVKKFKAKSITSSSPENLTATADSDAILSPSSIKINRLASNDTLVSKQMNITEKADLIEGRHTFRIKVRDEGEEDSESDKKVFKEIDISIAFSESETNESAMKKIASALNANTDLDFTASYLKDSSTTGRLVFTSKFSGEEYKIDIDAFQGEGGKKSNIDKFLGFDKLKNDRSKNSEETDGAYFRIPDSSKLNSELEVNGIKVTRNSNTIDDLLPGVTLNLLKIQDAEDPEIIIKPELDVKSIIGKFQPLIDAYNESVKFLSSDRSMLRADTALSGILSQFRSLVSQSVEPATPDAEGAKAEEIAPRYLTDMGMKINKDGTIGDQSKLEDMLKADGGEARVAHFFTSSDGFAARLNSIIEKVTEDKGLLQMRTESFDRQLESNKTKTSTLQSRIDRQAESLRKQYTSMLDSYYTAQNQYGTLGNIM